MAEKAQQALDVLFDYFQARQNYNLAQDNYYVNYPNADHGFSESIEGVGLQSRLERAREPALALLESIL